MSGERPPEAATPPGGGRARAVARPGGLPMSGERPPEAANPLVGGGRAWLRDQGGQQ